MSRAEAGEADARVAAEAEAVGCESGRGATMIGSVTFEGNWGTPDDDDGKEDGAETVAGVSSNDEDGVVEAVEVAGTGMFPLPGGGGGTVDETVTV